MRLHHLSVEAFGPFVARQEIDFDDVSGAGVFLVHGPTGAGKTSLLDAICFALFSDVPGDRQARGLRSELAEPDCPPRVRLEFTAAGRRLRVERTAEFTRPKRRGTGQVRVQSTVTLSEFAGSQWRPVSTRIDEAAEVLQDLLGMGLNQFRRVALLPQGDFAAFLHTTPEARRALLERLFDVERFTTLESWFAERRRTLTQQVAAAQQALHHQIATLTDVLATAPPAALAPLSDADELAFAAVPVGEWAGLVPRLEVALSAWAGDEFGAFQRAETQEQAAGARRDEAERIAGLRARARVASDALTRLREDATRIEVLRQRAADGLAAAGLRAELAAVASAERIAAEAVSRLQAARQSAAGAGLDPDAAAGLVPTLESGARSLADLGRNVEQARALATEIVDLAEAVARAGETAVQLQSEAATAATQQAAARTRCAALVAVAGSAPLWASRRREADAMQRLQHALATSSVRLTAAEGAQSDATAALVLAQETLIAGQRARLGDLAAELAVTLTDGDPCPVCGSVEHPAAQTDRAQWDPATIAAAEAEVERCRDHLEKCRLDVARAVEARAGQLREMHERLAALAAGEPPSHLAALLTDLLARESLADTETAATLARLAREVGAQHDAATTAATALQAAEAEVEALDEQRQAIQERLAAARDRAAAAGARQDAAQVRLDETLARARHQISAHSAECVCGATDPELDSDNDDEGVASDVVAMLAAWHREATERHTAVERLVAGIVAADDRAREAEAAYAAADAALRVALRGSVFATREKLRQALMSTDDLRAAQHAVAEHDRLTAIHEATLADEQVRAALAVTDPPDPALAASAAEQARAACLEAARRHTTAQRTTEQATGIAREIVFTATQSAPLHAQLDEVGELADLLAGTSANNALRMRLSAFVLAARLERVVELANERLAMMDAGRYRLLYDDARAARGARSGLGLLVHDEWSGTTRAPGSLSGGESFMASLALALGLADAIRESSGGQEVQTLFVDEGFGSLDEESLENVMTVLDGLRDGGRTVGIVSHVGDLRDRIPVRIEVRKSPHGSSVVLTAADSAA